jgi:hypothetical protein
VKPAHLIQQMNSSSTNEIVRRKTLQTSMTESSRIVISKGNLSHIYAAKRANTKTSMKTHTGGSSEPSFPNAPIMTPTSPGKTHAANIKR